MKGLLLKDLYVMWEAMKIPYAVLLLCAFIPKTPAYTIFIMVVSMFPITSFIYDEQSNWLRTQATMPYTKYDIIFGKYFLGMILVAISTLASVGAQALADTIARKPFTLADLYLILGTTVVCMLVQSLLIPLTFRFGAERGRVAMVLFVGAAIGLWVVTMNAIASQLQGVQFNISMPLSFAGVTVLFYGGSIIASIRSYETNL